MSGYGQRKKKKLDRFKDFNPLTFELYYGNSVFTKNFHRLNTVDGFDPKLPIRQIGLGLSNYDFQADPRRFVSAEYGLSFYLPESIILNDTIRSSISGFCWNMGLGKPFFKKTKTFRLNFYLGFNTGRTALTGGDNLYLKNAYFAPKATLQPKLIIKRICISLIFNYSYDISDQNWKKMRRNNNDYSLDKFDQTNFSAFVALGYRPFGL